MTQSQFSSLIDRLKRELKSRLNEPNLSPDVFQAAVDMSLEAVNRSHDANFTDGAGAKRRNAHILRSYTEHPQVGICISLELLADIRSFVSALEE